MKYSEQYLLQKLDNISGRLFKVGTYVFLRSLFFKKEVATRSSIERIIFIFFGFSLVLGLLNNLPGLLLRELLIISPKPLSIATTAVTLSVLVLEFSIAISLALSISTASLVALIGRVSVVSKSMPKGLSNFSRSDR